MIRVILWDVDGTLLDFSAAERSALRACFLSFGLGECTDAQLARYSALNKRYWRRLEDGELTKAALLTGRFTDFFSQEQIADVDATAFNEAYQLRLGDTVVFIDGAYEVIRRLRGRVRQYAASNGTATAQMRKLTKSGLIDLFDGVFISEQVGAEKPSRAFFDAVLGNVGDCAASEVMIVGDSLTSDMRGGNAAGIICCWYNPDCAPVPDGLRIDASITSLRQVEGILDKVN